MLFDTIQFFLFLAVVLVFFYSAPQRWRKLILLTASYCFYASWNFRFVPLLLTLTAIDFTAGLWLERVPPSRKKTVLALSLAANLSFLGFFKYYNFLAAGVSRLLGRGPDAFALSIVLPLGISFHTFQSMSYVIDVYRGEQAAIRDPIDYGLFIAFFPQLVAGPIVRAGRFFKDLLCWEAPKREEISSGILLIAFGLLKKMAFADNFAKLANAYFANPTANAGMAAAWTGVVSFGLQIYFDFSGYTDMAIGMALLLGFRFPQNFRRPYLAASVTDFWRRWHISLSSWLRDYLYIPLGGNRNGSIATYRNLMLTMLLGGLWHGASWNFIVWGGYHGVLLSAERMIGRGRDGLEKKTGTWHHVFSVSLTLLAVFVGWVFFRTADLSQSRFVLGQMLSGGRSNAGLKFAPWHFELIALSFLIALTEEHYGWFERVTKGPVWAYACTLGLILVCLEIFAVTDVSIPFVYFQF